MTQKTTPPWCLRSLKDLIKRNPQLAAEIGLRLDLPYLGEGSFGHVYALDERRAVKITRSSSETKKARHIMTHRPPHVVRIYRVVTTRDDEHIIVMERLRRIPDWASKALYKGKTPDRLHTTSNSITFGFLRQKRLANNVFSARELRFFRHIDAAYVSLIRHDIPHGDIHDGNIMVNSRGTFKVIDVM